MVGVGRGIGFSQSSVCRHSSGGAGQTAVISVVGIPARLPDSAIGVFGFVGEPGNPIYPRVLSNSDSA